MSPGAMAGILNTTWAIPSAAIPTTDVPPVASWFLSLVIAEPFKSEHGAIQTGSTMATVGSLAGLTSRESGWLAVSPSESVTTTVKVYDRAAAAGRPVELMVPVGSSKKPDGSVDPDAGAQDQV